MEYSLSRKQLLRGGVAAATTVVLAGSVPALAKGQSQSRPMTH